MDGDAQKSDTPTSDDSLRARLRSGLTNGLKVATVFSALVVIVGIVAGNAPFERVGLHWTSIVAVYYLAFALGGCGYGLLLPWKQYPMGAMLLGFVVMSPLYVGFALVLSLAGKGLSSVRSGVLLALVLGAVSGGALGIWWWMDDQKGGTDVDGSQ